jgi:hypothetical protein
MSDACDSATKVPQRQGAGEGAPPGEHERAPPPGGRDDPQDGLDGQRGDAGDREQQPDLGVGQRQLVADQRPGGLAGAEDELVEQLDRQQRRHGAAERPPDQQSGGRTSSHADKSRNALHRYTP